MRKILLITIVSVVGVACSKPAAQPFNKHVNFRNNLPSQTKGNSQTSIPVKTTHNENNRNQPPMMVPFKL